MARIKPRSGSSPVLQFLYSAPPTFVLTVLIFFKYLVAAVADIFEPLGGEHRNTVFKRFKYAALISKIVYLMSNHKPDWTVSCFEFSNTSPPPPFNGQ